MSSVSSESHEAIDHKTSIKYAGTFDVLCLGLTIVIGGQVFSWNPLLLSGFWESLTGLLSTALMYFCLVFCISEMTSALPFSGGSYGFVRVCIGPFFGYVIGCCESLQNVAYVVSAVIPLSQMLSLLLKMDHTYEPLTWVFFFFTALAFNILGKNYFWKLNLVIGMVSLVLIVFYIASTIQYIDFYKFSGIQQNSFDGGNFMTYLPYCAWFFIGIEGLPLVCVDCDKPATEIPCAMVGCMIILFFSGMGVFFVSLSQSPGIEEVATAAIPLNFGYSRFLGISEDTATWLAIPAAYGTGFGFMFMYGRQMNSMARSGLFPAMFKLRTKFSHTPYASLAFGSLVAVLGVVIIHTTDPAYLDQVFLVCVLSSYLVYISVFISYLLFQHRYSTMQREFTNPLGRFAPIYGLAFSLVGIASILGFQEGAEIPVLIFVGYLIFLIVFYYCYGYKTQILSEDEQKVMFKAYVMNGKLVGLFLWLSLIVYIVNVMKRVQKKGRKAGSVGRDGVSVLSGSSVVPSNFEAADPNYLKDRQIIPRQENEDEVGDGKGEEEFIDDMTTHLHARSCDKTTPCDIELGKTPHEKQQQVQPEQQVQPAELITRTNHIMWSSKMPELISNNKVAPIVISPSSSTGLVGLEGVINASQSTKVLEVRNAHPDLVHRKSFLHSLSEKVQEVFQDMKLVPLLPDDQRRPYEEMIIAEMCGKLSDKNEE